ncbi:SHOCT domain-containing protein [Sedimenticola selenatireducens]|uniref:SHOCT domain-containing protein n=1 Tax=Sedimenticola selenatireducens TaxID=191960 RepID=A0A557RV29_9GAMM|nr:SHOCT domain-containing protein [Sedimenticola selenatireducens]TVO69005.1 SHOCT domain-containing protein [Sedimenticola selenatireducens]TVT60889.1 MAG: SHOCT domain-containing protein [Sedimenticola selenatireducens]
MDTSEFGFWAMLVFWGSAIGGIALGISWAKMKGRNPVNRSLLEKSLQKRLDAGEITPEIFEQKIEELNRNSH